MPKESKTKREIADMLAARISVGGVQIAVFPSKVYGWEANVVVAPSIAVNTNAVLQQHVAELRELYDLKV